MARRPSILSRLWHAVTGTTPETRGQRDYWPYGVQTKRACEERAKLTAARAAAKAERDVTKKRAREIAAELAKSRRGLKADAALVGRIAAKEQRAALAERKRMARAAADAVMLELRAQKSAERAEKVAARASKRSVPAAVARAAAGDDIAERVARGEIKGSALRELMASGALAIKKNPAAMKLLAKLRRPADKKNLQAAFTVARDFHGDGQSAAVIELSEKERVKPPRFLTVVGDINSLDYQPPDDSERGRIIWTHESGDKGPFEAPSTAKPILAVDPSDKKRFFIVPDKSKMTFSTKKGIVG